MGNILVADVKVRGTRTIWWHWFGPDAIPLEKRERTGVAGNDPEEWKRTVLSTNEGQLYILNTYIFGCMKEAAKYTKKGRGSIQKMVVATLQVQPEIVLVDRHIPNFDNGLPVTMPTDPTLPVYLDIRGVVNPSTRGRNIRYRVAASPGWEMSFQLEWDATIVSREQMNAVLIDAGNLVGVGSGRNIGRGRFKVIELNITE